MVINAGDRLAEVLARDERMLEIFLAASPALQGLRNPAARRVMGRLATVGEVARIAGLEPDLLVRRVNHALESSVRPEESPARRRPRQHTPGDLPTGGETSSPPAGPTATDGRTMEAISPEMPPALAAIPVDLVSELDVRDDLRRGQEPFSRIMAARQQLAPGGALKLRATFEPVPLYAVMGKQGLAHWTVQLGAEDWCVWFYRAAEPVPSQAEAASEARAPSDAPAQATAAGGGVEPDRTSGEEIVIIDVRGLEPPEPMVLTLSALESLPEGVTLLQINERVPQFLLPKLEELGFTHEVREQANGPVRVFIRRKLPA